MVFPDLSELFEKPKWNNSLSFFVHRRRKSEERFEPWGGFLKNFSVDIPSTGRWVFRQGLSPTVHKSVHSTESESNKDDPLLFSPAHPLPQTSYLPLKVRLSLWNLTFDNQFMSKNIPVDPVFLALSDDVVFIQFKFNSLDCSLGSAKR